MSSETCIYCLDGGGRLLRNNKCPCNYVFHSECDARYDRKTVCPMCRGAVAAAHEVIEVKLPGRAVRQTSVPMTQNPRRVANEYTQLASGPEQQIRQTQMLRLLIFIGCLIGIAFILYLFISLFA